MGVFFDQYEPQSNEIIQRYVRPGDVVIEAGANNGTETLLLAEQVGAFGRIFAFEPVPHLADWLELNLMHNHFHDRVSVERLALGERATSVTFHLAPRSFSNQGMSSKIPFSVATGQLDVRQVTLDDWIRLKEIEQLDFLKMDIQGAEIDLLRGAVETIRAHHPVIFTEASCSKLSIDELFRTLREFGYDIFAVEASCQIVPLEDSHSLSEGNWLAMHSSDKRARTIYDNTDTPQNRGGK